MKLDKLNIGDGVVLSKDRGFETDYTVEVIYFDPKEHDHKYSYLCVTEMEDDNSGYWSQCKDWDPSINENGSSIPQEDYDKYIKPHEGKISTWFGICHISEQIPNEQFILQTMINKLAKEVK